MPKPIPVIISQSCFFARYRAFCVALNIIENLKCNIGWKVDFQDNYTSINNPRKKMILVVKAIEIRGGGVLDSFKVKLSGPYDKKSLRSTAAV